MYIQLPPHTFNCSKYYVHAKFKPKTYREFDILQLILNKNYYILLVRSFDNKH